MINLNFLYNSGWALWLPLLAVIALPFGRSVELFVLIMAIIGIYDLIKNHQNLRQSSGLKAFSLFFLCVWLPALLSLPDAVNLNHSASNVFGTLRFYFAGIFILSRLSSHKSQLWLGTGIGLVLLFWFGDAWLQLLIGKDLFGLPPFSSNRISGVFGDDAKLGLMIIPFLGVAIAALKERSNMYIVTIFTLLAISVILISGDRSSWVSLFAAVLFFLFLFRPKNLTLSRSTVLVSVIGTLLIATAVINTSQFQARLDNSLTGLNGDYESVNKASSFRLPIWKTALRMFADNPINGVGARGFRYAYPDYADPDDIFVNNNLPKEQQTGAFQSHQIVLEFLAETGIIGFIGYLLTLWIMFIKWRPIALNGQSALASGYLISLMAIFFPLNSHLSSFSSDWAQVLWLLVALCVSSLAVARQEPKQ
ncbi:MAG: O-antigen ligase family protein [Gammaproteobacteria bacterium]|nr:O-antigen ligase family protein [Gammaproteobacteria bacterium]